MANVTAGTNLDSGSLDSGVFRRNLPGIAFLSAATAMQAFAYVSQMPGYSHGDFGLSEIIGIKEQVQLYSTNFNHEILRSESLSFGYNSWQHFIGGLGVGSLIKRNITDVYGKPRRFDDHRSFGNTRGIKNKISLYLERFKEFSSITLFSLTSLTLISWEIFEGIKGNPIASVDTVKDYVMGMGGLMVAHDSTIPSRFYNFTLQAGGELKDYVVSLKPRVKSGFVAAMDSLSGKTIDELEEELDE